MKFVIVVCFIAVVGCTFADDSQSRGCIYIEGKCFSECEEGTHSYTTGCDYVMPEATCANQHPVIDMSMGEVCDFTACYCDSPTVRDEASGKCVHPSKCPQNPQ